jgi:hypothetical protein
MNVHRTWLYALVIIACGGAVPLQGSEKGAKAAAEKANAALNLFKRIPRRGQGALIGGVVGLAGSWLAKNVLDHPLLWTLAGAGAGAYFIGNPSKLTTLQAKGALANAFVEGLNEARSIAKTAGADKKALDAILSNPAHLKEVQANAQAFFASLFASAPRTPPTPSLQ